VARALTFTTLRRLDGERKASVLRFLYQANLIRRYIPIIDLGGPNDYYGADLTKVELQGASLDGVYLCQVNLREADLSDALVIRADLRWSDMRSGQFRNAGLDASELDYARLNGAMLIDARLRGARLVNADLTNADLAGANLANADLRGANLTGANVTNEQLATAKSLAGAILQTAASCRRLQAHCHVASRRIAAARHSQLRPPHHQPRRARRMRRSVLSRLWTNGPKRLCLPRKSRLRSEPR
jgi:hypothetical protein